MIKNTVIFAIGFLAGFLFMLIITTSVFGMEEQWTDTQLKTHQIAEIARSIGLSEDNPIIKESSRIWWEEAVRAEEAKREADAEFLQTYHTEAVMIAKTMYGEAKGIGSKRELSMIAWTILNRFDSGQFGTTIAEVITSPRQFAYRKSAPTVNQCGVDLLSLAEDVLLRWQAEREGQTEVGRTLPKGYYYYWGDGFHNYFKTTDRGKGQLWFEGYGDPYV